ncbi:MAG: hypothetical protein HY736_03165 [Verrucomicrobia bacterium]|nr:hypothetical protein [Verrucomicrobiota bacterium]
MSNEDAKNRVRLAFELPLPRRAMASQAASSSGFNPAGGCGTAMDSRPETARVPSDREMDDEGAEMARELAIAGKDSAIDSVMGRLADEVEQEVGIIIDRKLDLQGDRIREGFKGRVTGGN